MSAPDLFAGLAVDYGIARPPLHRARKLVARVEALAEATDGFYDDCERVAREARALSAHAVARAVRWLAHPESFERYGHDGTHIRVERVAHAWLERHERALIDPSQRSEG